MSYAVRSFHKDLYRQVDINQCIHTVSGALGSASTITNMMSMKNVGDSIKGLLSALKTHADFNGPLAMMNDQGFADLDQRIQAMQKTMIKLGI